MGAYMKNYYTGWITSIPQITVSGTYWVKPITSTTKNAYWIASPYSATEYFVVEYRRKLGTFENSLPGSGLLVYRINSSFAGMGNAQYDGSSIFDEIYIYRPNGTPTANGTVNSAHYSSNVGRTAINDGTNPSSFLHDGSSGGLDISAVGTSDDSISFYVTFPGAVQEPGGETARSLALIAAPNPFRTRTDIRLQITDNSLQPAALQIYDISGRLVKSFSTIDIGHQSSVIWNGDDDASRALPAGIYICRLSYGSYSVVRKLIRLD
jgi:hypothetical protein